MPGEFEDNSEKSACLASQFLNWVSMNLLTSSGVFFEKNQLKIMSGEVRMPGNMMHTPTGPTSQSMPAEYSKSWLISDDSQLIDSIAELDSPKNPIYLNQIYSDEVNSLDLSLNDILVIHLGQEGLTNEKTIDLVKLASATISPERIIVIDDKHSSSRGIAFHARGLRHYLARPLNLGQLKLTLEMLRLANPTAKSDPAANTKAAATSANSAGHGYLTRGGGESYDALMRSVMKVAKLDTTVLLTGETGTGKSHLARVIHESGPRAAKPLVVVNCAAISPAVFESELFGHVQGSSASAQADRSGKLTEAAGGTIFLDEIDSLPAALQARLLRVVEEKVYEPVGSNKTLPLQARIVVASNRDLKTEVAEGRFRSDLFYRLNVVSFEVPPLRTRKSLVGNLLTGFLRESSTRMGVKLPSVSPEAGQLLEQYDWPGNIRELRNVVERAVALCDNDLITPAELTEDIRGYGVATQTVPTGHGYSAVYPVGPDEQARHTLYDVVESREREMILESMNRNRFNLLKTAKDLGISRMTLYKKLEKYQIQRRVQSEQHLTISQVG